MSVLDKLSELGEFFIEEQLVKPNRRVFVFEAGKVRELFQKLIEILGYDNFYVATIVGTDLIDEGKIRLDYYVVLLPDEVTVVFRTFIPRDKPEIDSLFDLIPGVLSGECETHDLLGVVFRGNPHLRRGFFVAKDIVEKGVYPLRKDTNV
ncbi:MAG: NADH-quinone oxidoreductase subunit C [Thermoprotei archaeon]